MAASDHFCAGPPLNGEWFIPLDACDTKRDFITSCREGVKLSRHIAMFIEKLESGAYDPVRKESGMFERYTERARCTIFFARYEAAQFGSVEITTEHLMLGLLREEKRLDRLCPNLDPESLRDEILAQIPRLPSTSTSIDLPLSNHSKRALKYAADEADRLAHRPIGTEHLLLGLLDQETCLAAKLLVQRGARVDDIRQRVAAAQLAAERLRPALRDSYFHHRTYAAPDTVEIHGFRWNADYIRDAVRRCREISRHWQKSSWTARDVVIHRETGRVSFDLSLAESTKDFDLVKGGWRRDHCAICHWELHEAKEDPERGTGHTNGLQWICNECHGRFIERDDFFQSNFSDIT